jgi:hypothetical protein
VHEGADGVRVTADLRRARLEPHAIPALIGGSTALGVDIDVGGERVQVHSLSIGTAHTVIFGIPDNETFLRLSPLLEHHALFPERTSVMWTDIVGPDHVRVRIWERGVGETFACGTGAGAVAVATHLLGRAGRRVQVTSRGGTLAIDIGEGLFLRQTGPAAVVYTAEWRGAMNRIPMINTSRLPSGVEQKRSSSLPPTRVPSIVPPEAVAALAADMNGVETGEVPLAATIARLTSEAPPPITTLEGG